MKTSIELSEISVELRKTIAREIEDVEVLEYLAQDKNCEVREVVAKSRNTTAEILDKLSKDEDWIVRYEIAKNHNTSIETLRKLVKDEVMNVSYCAKRFLRLRG